MEVVEENMHRVSAGVAGEPHYEDLFPETISLSFALNSGDTVHLSLRRNRNINSDVPVYTDDGQPTVSQWNPPSNHVSMLISGRLRSARFGGFYHPCVILSTGGRVSMVPGPFLVPGPMSFLEGRVSLVPCSF